MASTIKGITVSIGGDTTNLKKSLEGVDKTSKDLQRELNLVNKELKFNPDSATLLAQKQEILAEKVNATREKLNKLNEVQEQVERQAKSGDLGAEEYRAYQREVEKTKSQLGYLENELGKTGEKFNEVQRRSGNVNFKNAEDKVDHLKGKFKDLAEDAVKHLDVVSEKANKLGDGLDKASKPLNVVSGAAAAGLGATIKFASDFEDAMAKVNTIADTSQKPLDELREEILNLSNETGVESVTIAENVYDAISAGQDTADAVNFVRNSIALSKAGFADAGAALDVLTTIMNAYGMSADKVNYVSDMLIQTQNLGKVTVGELASSMGKVIPTANSYGVQLDQLAAAYSITTAKGIAAAESTTYINSMLNELGKSGTESSKVLKDETGKSFSELMSEGKSLSDVLAILKKSADKQNKSLGDMFGSAEAAKAATTILGDGVSAFNDRLKEMNGSTGATSNALEKLKTPSTEAKKVLNELKNDAIVLGSEALIELKPLLEDAGKGIKGITEWIKKLNPEQKQALIHAIEIVAVAGPAVKITGGIAKGISSIASVASSLIPKLVGATAAQEGLNVAMDSNPVGAVVLAITALIAALGGLFFAIQQAKEQRFEDLGFTEQAEKLQESVDKVKELQNEVNGLKDDINKTVESNSVDMSMIEDYKKELDELLGKATLTPEEQAELVTIGDYFSEKYPDFKTAWDKYKKVDDDGTVKIDEDVKKIKDNLDSLIEKYKKVAASNALMNLGQKNQEGFLNAQQNVNKTAVELRKAQDELKKFLSNWNITEEQLKNTPGFYTWQNQDNTETAKVSDLLEQYNTLKGNIDTLEQSYDELAESAAQFKTNTNDIARMQAVVNGNYDDAAAVMMAYNANLITASDIEKSRWGSLENLQKKAKETAEKSGTNIVFGFNNSVEKFKEEIKKEGMRTVDWYLDGVDTKGEMHSPSKAMYRRGVFFVQGFFNGLMDKIGLSKIWNASKSIAGYASGGTNNLPNEMFRKGLNFVQGFINGLMDKTGLSKIWTATKNIASNTINSIKKFLGIQSPSKEAEKLGRFFGMGFINGIEQNQAAVREAAQKLSDEAKASLSNADFVRKSSYASTEGYKNIRQNLDKIKNSYASTEGYRNIRQNLDKILNTYASIDRLRNSGIAKTQSRVNNINNSTSKSINGGVNVTINQARLDTDADVERMGEKLADIIIRKGMEWG